MQVVISRPNHHDSETQPPSLWHKEVSKRVFASGQGVSVACVMHVTRPANVNPLILKYLSMVVRCAFVSRSKLVQVSSNIQALWNLQPEMIRWRDPADLQGLQKSSPLRLS